MLRQISLTCGFEYSPHISASPPFSNHPLFLAPEKHTEALFKKWEELVTLISQGPAFRHFNPFIRSVSLDESPLLSGPRINTPGEVRRDGAVLHFPESSRRGGMEGSLTV